MKSGLSSQKHGILIPAILVVGLAISLGAALGVASPSGRTGTSRQQHESVVINIEVPVRVLKRDTFVDTLTLGDFEVYEDGVLQPVEAVYLIKDRQVLREEKTAGATPPRPRSVRNYVLYLDLKEYIPRVGNALDYFFTDVLGLEDTLFVVTPAKTYRFKSEALASVPRARIADRLKDKLKTDIPMGNSEYRNLMRDFYKLEEEEFPAELMDVKENLLYELAKQMRDLKEVTEAKVMGFADTLKTLEGEKHVFLIYQKDVLPNHVFTDDRLLELFKPVNFDVDKIKRYYADASITIHCLYITKTPFFARNPMSQTRTTLTSPNPDLSADVYASFKEMASATGGLTETTTNPNFALRQAAEASSNYYLLYYRPLNYRADGHFRKIEVRVKGSGLKVTHRLGYIAD